MFKNDGYETAAYNQIVPEDTRMFIRRVIQRISDKSDTDYLQVFTLKPVKIKGKTVQEIKNTQEEPDKDHTYRLILPDDQIITEKIYVIDNLESHTYMIASEY